MIIILSLVLLMVCLPVMGRRKTSYYSLFEPAADHAGQTRSE